MPSTPGGDPLRGLLSVVVFGFRYLAGIFRIHVKGYLIALSHYSFLRMVTLSGICGPLCSSPATAGTNAPDPNFRTSCPLSGREKSNCLTSVTKKVWSSTRLLTADNQSVSHSLLFDILPPRGETYANRHPIQPLGPPEKVALNQRTSAHGKYNGHIITLRTGCYRPQQATQAFRSFRTIVPVGIHKRPAPKRPCSCEM